MAIVSFDFVSSNGIAAFTGSPGEGDCTSCHFGTNINAGGGSIVITGVPTNYVLLQTYSIDVTVTQFGRSLFGFDVEALASTNTDAGVFQITNNAETQLVVASNLRENVTNKVNGGLSLNAHTFTFEWIAPSSDVGPITFYATGNAANGDGNEFGDLIYSASTISTPVGIFNPHDNYFDLNVFPNPVKGKLKVDYVLNKSGWITMDLFSIDGKERCNLLKEKQVAGRQTKQLEIPELIPNGIYFLSICSGSERAIKKILIEH